MEKASIDEEVSEFLEIKNDVVEQMEQIEIRLLRIDKHLTFVSNILDRY